MLNNITREVFEPHINGIFDIVLEGGVSIQAVLIGVQVIESPTPTTHESPDRREPFSLLFRVREEPPLQQRIYHFNHSELGSLDIFIVPVGRDEEGMLYEAVFN